MKCAWIGLESACALSASGAPKPSSRLPSPSQVSSTGAWASVLRRCINCSKGTGSSGAWAIHCYHYKIDVFAEQTDAGPLTCAFGIQALEPWKLQHPFRCLFASPQTLPPFEFSITARLNWITGTRQTTPRSNYTSETSDTRHA